MKALTALTLGKPLAPVSGMKPIPTAEPQSDVLFEMFNGALGSVHLGRLLKGHDAGRLVTLRKLPAFVSEELLAAADLARSVAHPKLVKLLGMIHEQNARYLVSEHLSGVTLFELGRTASNRQLPVDPSVAVRIVLDMLTAAVAAQSLLTETLGSQAMRCVYPECVWIADFGETFLSEVLVAPLLGRRETPGSAAPTNAAIRAADVRSAALELTRLACAGLSPDDPLETDISHLPDELQEVLLPALGLGSIVGYSSPQEFIDAILELDESLVATEEQVAEELRRLMGTVLNLRRQKLDMLERGASSGHAQDQGDETKFFRLALKTEQRVTARPPPDSATMQTAPVKAAVAPASQKPPSSPKPTVSASAVIAPVPVLDVRAPEQLDEPTMLFMRESDGITRSDFLAQSAAEDPNGPDVKVPFDPLLYDPLHDDSASPEQSSPHETLGFSRRTEDSRPARRGRAIAWACLAALIVCAGLRVGWLMHRDHVSFGTAWSSQTQALGSLVR